MRDDPRGDDPRPVREDWDKPLYGARDQFGGPVDRVPRDVELTPGERRRRSRLVRRAVLMTLLTTLGLSFIPRPPQHIPPEERGLRIPDRERERYSLADGHMHGAPFRVAEFTRGESMSLKVHPTGLLGNAFVSGALVLGVIAFRRRRRED